MSDLALTDSGEQKTASEFHDDYILHGVKHENFMCPFCFIGLVAKAIYTEGPQGKSPHFSCFPKKPHINGCDGYPIVDGKSVKGGKKKNKIKIGKEEFTFPEKLVPRSRPSQYKLINDLNTIIKEDTPKKVAQRRKKAGEEVGTAKYTSSLIRSFASSKKAMLSLIYKYAKEENLSNKDKNLLIKNILSQAPIELDGYKTTYQVAFQGTKFFSKYNKIWNGKGLVKIKGEVVYILSDQVTEYSDNGHDYELSFYMAIKIPENLNENPAYHQAVINRLLRAHERGKTVKWHGYGTASLILDKNSVLLEIDNLDNVFIEKI